MEKDLLDKILVKVINIEEKVNSYEGRFTKLEDAHDRTFNRLDGFLHIINRHEAEIAAQVC